MRVLISAALAALIVAGCAVLGTGSGTTASLDQQFIDMVVGCDGGTSTANLDWPRSAPPPPIGYDASPASARK